MLIYSFLNKFINDVSFSIAVGLFVKCKSNDIKSTTYTIMGKLMTDSVAVLYSWTGAKQNKEKFEKSPFCKVLESKFIIIYNI